jgi:GntR family transcriptional repressor for pyruvate dehydrogenase complex
MAKTASPRKADEVSKEILFRIVSGQIAPGTLLPKEEELEAEFGVGRSVVREAVKLLEVHRLVLPVRRRGTVVLDPRASLSPEVVAAFLDRRTGPSAHAFLVGLLEVRKLLDVEMAGLAAARRTDEDITALRKSTEVFAARAAAGEDVEDAVLAFGLVIASATKNPIYTMLVHWNSAAVRELRPVFAGVRASAGAHAQGLAMVVEAITRGDVNEARQLTALFHDWSGPQIVAAASR